MNNYKLSKTTRIVLYISVMSLISLITYHSFQGAGVLYGKLVQLLPLFFYCVSAFFISIAYFAPNINKKVKYAIILGYGCFLNLSWSLVPGSLTEKELHSLFDTEVNEMLEKGNTVLSTVDEFNTLNKAYVIYLDSLLEKETDRHSLYYYTAKSHRTVLDTANNTIELSKYSVAGNISDMDTFNSHWLLARRKIYKPLSAITQSIEGSINQRKYDYNNIVNILETEDIPPRHKIILQKMADFTRKVSEIKIKNDWNHSEIWSRENLSLSMRGIVVGIVLVCLVALLLFGKTE